MNKTHQPKRKLSLSIGMALLMNGVILVVLILYGWILSDNTTSIAEGMSMAALEDINELTYYLVDTSVDSSIKNYLRGIAEKNLDILNELHGMVVEGSMSEADAKSLAEDILLSQSIGDTGYIYCINSDALVTIHPLIDKGVSVTDFQFIQDQIRIKSGYIEYDWKNPGEPEERPKALYMAYFEPWDWIISASTYRDEFHSLIDMEELRESLLSITLGESGYIAAVNQQGTAVIHPFYEGVELIDAVDENGRYFIRDMIEKGNGELIYPWKNTNEVTERMKIALFREVEELDWVIIAGVYLDELYAETAHIRKNIAYMTLGAMLIVILITIIVALRLRIIEKQNQRLEENLRVQNEELEAQRQYLMESEKMSSLGQIVAGVAHEINTPLGASISAASYLDKVNHETRQRLQQGQMTKEDLKKLFATLDDSMNILNLNLRRSADLVQSFKRIAVNQSGEICEKFRLRQYIDDVLLSLKHEYKNRPITFDIQCPENLRMTNYPGAFSQVLTNLIMNSLIHAFGHEDEGVIGIECRVIDGQISLRYYDNGAGIDKEHLLHIFKPFFTTNRQEGGSGLGLSLVYNLVSSKMMGRITCSSTIGEGTIFDMLFPPQITSDKENFNG